MAAIQPDDIARAIDALEACAPLHGDYAIDDYVLNVALTVLDYQMQTVAGGRAREHFESKHSGRIRTHEDLTRFLAEYPDTEQGNTDAAVELFGYRLWTRVGLMRRLLEYFEARGVTDQASLRTWAHQSDFKRDFEGQVRIRARGRIHGLGLAVYNWLVMRQRIPSIKPDVHITRFFERAVGRRLSEQAVVTLGMAVAERLDVPAHELDWRIWECERARSRG